MVAFADVVPYFLWGLVGVAIILFVFTISRMIEVWRSWVTQRSTGEQAAEQAADQRREGIWWYIGEMIHVLLIIDLLIVALIILDYLINSPANVSIYTLVLGTWTVPTVLAIVLYYFVKIIPYALPGEAS